MGRTLLENHDDSGFHSVGVTWGTTWFGLFVAAPDLPPVGTQLLRKRETASRKMAVIDPFRKKAQFDRNS